MTDDNELVIRTTNSVKLPTVVDEFETGESFSSVTWANANHSYAELVVFRADALAMTRTMDGVTSLDLDETTGTIHVTATPKSRHDVFQELSEIIPEEVLVVSAVRGSPKPMSELNDNNVRPLAGGLEVALNRDTTGDGIGDSSSTQYCSLTLVVEMPDGSDGVTTGSHCTASIGATTSPNDIWQRDWSAGSDYIGVEVQDPAFKSWSYGVCAGVSNECRGADIAAFNIQDNDGDGLETTSADAVYRTNEGDLTIQGKSWYNSLAGDIDLLVGDSIKSINGQYGELSGTITETCVDHFDMYPNRQPSYDLACQYDTDLSNVDSGAPSFEVINNSIKDLMGVAYGLDREGEPIFGLFSNSYLSVTFDN